MDTRIQFRVDEEVKRLAQMMTANQGRTLSDACRELTEQLAEEQKKQMSQDAWLSEQVAAAFSKLDASQARFLPDDAARQSMAERKARIRQRG